MGKFRNFIKGCSLYTFLPIALVLTVGIAFSFYLYENEKAVRHDQLKAEFVRMAQSRVSAITFRIESYHHLLRHLKAFYAASEFVSREEFGRFVQPILRYYEGIQALEWAPVVRDEERDRFEQAARDEEIDRYSITERGLDGGMIPATHRKEYFPITYLEPLKGNEIAIGFDLGSDWVRLEVLNTARATGTMRATSRVTLAQESASQHGFHLVMPVYRRAAPLDTAPQRADALKGFLLGVFRVDDLVESALGDQPLEGIDLKVFDLSAPKGEGLVYSSRNAKDPWTGDLPSLHEPVKDKQPDDIGYAGTVNIANYQWKVELSPNEAFYTSHISTDPKNTLAAALFITALLAFFTAVLVGRVAKSETAVFDANARQLSTPVASGSLEILFFLLIVAILGWYALGTIKANIKNEMRDSLQAILNTTHEALKGWAHDRIDDARLFASSPEFRTLVEEQLAVPRTKEDLLQSDALARMRILNRSKLNMHDDLGFFVIAPDFVSVASMRDANVGSRNLLADHGDYLHAVFSGKPQLIHPMYTDVPIPGMTGTLSKEEPTMFVAVPVFGEDGRVIAAYTIRMDPAHDFSRIMQLAYRGETGETYAFDKQGRLLTESRFADDLRRVGLLKENQRGILSITVRDPGGDIYAGFHPTLPRTEQPFTKMAASAISGEEGTDVNGYRDYRGVPVVGAWLWDRQLGFGLTSEMNVMEAFRSYHTTRNTVILAFGIMLALAFAFSARMRRSLTVSEILREEALESRESLSEAQKIAHIGNWDWDVASGKLTWSEEIYRTFGHTPQSFEPSYDAFLNAIHPDDRENVQDAVNKALMEGKEYSIDHRVVLPDGTERVVHEQGQPHLAEDGRTVRMTGTVQDITDRKKTETALKFLSDRLTLATRSGGIGVWELDIATNEVIWDDRMYEIYGIPKDAGSGTYDMWRDRIHPDDLPSAETAIREAVEGKREFDIEFRIVLPDDRTRHVKGMAIMQRDKDGTPLRMTGVNWDVTVQRQAEHEIKKAKEIAETANKAKSEFLASMSHEIRTPMNAIIGMADLLGETRLSDEQEKFVNTFRYAGENLLAIINDILDISKIEAGQMELEAVPFDLMETLERTCEIMAIRAQEKELELAVAISPDVPLHLVGDPMRLRQVLINLLSNAIKFTEQGEVVVAVEPVGAAGEIVPLRFSIKDTGIGIPKEKRETIFDSFSQVDSSTTRKYGGTGLGLSISKQLVTLMNGNIWVESEEGKGSTFHFTATFPRGAEGGRKALRPAVDLSRVRILIVDDNATNRMILQKTLSNWGAQTGEAESGPLCLDKLAKAQAENDPYRMVLLDVHMPSMSGYEVAEKIRDRADLQTPAVLLSSSGGHGEREKKIKELGLAGYMLKPVKQTELRDMIDAVLGSVEATKPAPPAPARQELAEPPLNILLVEDNVDNRNLILAYLKKLPYEVDTAENGEIAVRKAADRDYDLILMDIEMPVMDGYAATKAIRAKEKEQDGMHTPIIALTAHALSEHREKTGAAGCDAHITKPIKKALLLETIKAYAKQNG